MTHAPTGANGTVSAMLFLLATIPSPSTPGISIGPMNIRMYGAMIALGALAGIWLARRRWAARGGNPDDIITIALWAVPAGLIGARLYHVITDNELYRGANWYRAFYIWQGGLGIPGGIAAGVAVGVFIGYRKNIRIPVGLDAIAPSLALAQAIGRWGNYFNQELFGGPTGLPWGLQIDAAHRPAGLTQYTAFHPTFLYEMLWNLGLVVLLILIDRRRVLRPGRIFALYVGGYFLGRLWVESLRSDTANLILGLRVNTWVSLIAIITVVVFLAVCGLRRRPDDIDTPYTTSPGPDGDEDHDEGPSPGSSARALSRQTMKDHQSGGGRAD